MYIYRIGAVIETDEGNFVIAEKKNGKPSKLEDINKYVASDTLLRYQEKAKTIEELFTMKVKTLRHQGKERSIEEILKMKVEEYIGNNRLLNFK